MKTLAIVALAACAGAAQAGESSGPKGYWFYEEPPEQLDSVESEPQNPYAEWIEVKERPPLPKPDHALLMTMHPADIREIYPMYRDQAVWKPTPDNVRDYYVVTDVVRRKAKNFTAVSQYVMQTNPALNMARAIPVNNPGIRAERQQRNAVMGQKLAQHSNDYALLFFTSETCPYCAAQEKILQVYRNRTGWHIKPIDKDRMPALAAEFGVDFVPQVIMVRRGSKDWMPIAVGVESEANLEINVYRAIRLMRGEIAPQQFLNLDHEDELLAQEPQLLTGGPQQ